MGRPRKFASEAEKQRTYRLQRKIASTDAEKLHYARLQKLHRVVCRAALDGNERAQEILGRNASDTALKLILATQPEREEHPEHLFPVDLFGFDMTYYAFEEATSTLMMQQAEIKDGVFRVVIGTEKRVPRKAQSIADRPKRQGKKRVGQGTGRDRAAPKSRKKTAL
jgi:hypothetical protein